MKRFAAQLAVALGLLISTEAHAELRRLAVVVGANMAPPGRTPLRYAHDDARAVAAVLQEVGEFRRKDVELLLDPEPERVVDAHESEALGGSFFTHHFNAGLRGAADENYRMKLQGRQDLPLTNLDRGESWMALEQAEGPLQVVHLQSGIVLAELPSGKQAPRVALPPGRYLVRRRATAGYQGTIGWVWRFGHIDANIE